MRCEFDDPALLTPHERLRELAVLLATGIQRLRSGCSVSPEFDRHGPDSRENSLESSSDGLEFLSCSHPDGTCQPETTREE